MSEDLDFAPTASSTSATEGRQESMPNVVQDDERAFHENISTISCPFLTNTAGKIVYIEFLLASDSCLFSIDLFTTDDDSGIAFHMEIPSDDQLVTFNSVKDNNWGLTETAARFPFEHGGHFVVTIETTAGYYETKVNGKLLYAYNHRWPIQSVKRFQMIQENLKDVQVSVNGSWTIKNLTNVRVLITSKCSGLNLLVKKDARTITTGKQKSAKAQFHFAQQYDIGVYTLRSIRYDDKYLAIIEKELLAVEDGEYNAFLVTETNDGCYRFRSYKNSEWYIGVDETGKIVSPTDVTHDCDTRSHFYNGYNREHSPPCVVASSTD
ncbi:uncharacterized protein LOC134182532 isoform X2 [Corticium candelabrum]|uniref:uncharacterized protein LOC134182532 isoform X2 n=1 Tax=Corticium candelabrum TaxID=121492 RepID=UPI002E2543FA|nr:uncharacterized protein LOC134182532 isoform X2 [Corticium candelabrum]